MTDPRPDGNDSGDASLPPSRPMSAAEQQHLLNLLREASRNGSISNFGGLLRPQIVVATSTAPAPAHIQRTNVAEDIIAAAQRQLQSTIAAPPAPVVPPAAYFEFWRPFGTQFRVAASMAPTTFAQDNAVATGIVAHCRLGAPRAGYLPLSARGSPLPAGTAHAPWEAVLPSPRHSLVMVTKNEGSGGQRQVVGVSDRRIATATAKHRGTAAATPCHHPGKEVRP